MTADSRDANEGVFGAVDVTVAVRIQPAKMFGVVRRDLHLVHMDILIVVFVVLLETVLERRKEWLVSAFAEQVDDVSPEHGHALGIGADLRYPPQPLAFIQ